MSGVHRGDYTAAPTLPAITIDLGQHREVVPSVYSLRAGSVPLRGWTLSGSMDGQTWALLDDSSNSTAPTEQEPPAPVVVTGPSGVGKGTLVAALLEAHPHQVGLCVSHTTRDPRPGEEDGKQYHFVSTSTMEAMIADGLFLEHATVHGNLYGSSRAAVEQVRAQGKVCLLEIDTQGAEAISELDGLGARFVFIAPPSLEQLEARLRARGTESEEQTLLRLHNAETEMASLHRELLCVCAHELLRCAHELLQEGLWDHVLVNNHIQAAVSEFESWVLPPCPPVLPVHSSDLELSAHELLSLQLSPGAAAYRYFEVSLADSSQELQLSAFELYGAFAQGSRGL
eukprot:TRINITY_DN6220_c0_g1_i1.p1 TRINITY_DN6220_c0_g1~~TRINITY_DN6220_c0_g1_i1.p1  ORF type:complete len:342 (+),score=109.13 TRINITY_DN6220_c0_g1_i1:1233-2258(+)